MFFFKLMQYASVHVGTHCKVEICVFCFVFNTFPPVNLNIYPVDAVVKCFLGESSLNCRSGGLNIVVISFARDINYNTIVEGDKDS